MKLIWKILKIVGIAVVVILLVAAAGIYFSGPQLPPDIDDTIDEVMQSDLPEFVKGDAGYVYPDSIKVWYESIGPDSSSKGAVLLFMGIANDALGWPQRFIDELVDSGYQVIRYDYRGTGMSDWLPDWEQSPYSLADLASDARLILDTLHLERAHLVGLSMGGMVAQEFAIHFPQRMLTLACIMSSGDIQDKDLEGLSLGTTFALIRIGIKYGVFSSERNAIKLHIAARMILRGDAEYAIDVKGTAVQVLYDLRRRNGYNPHVSRQHEEAVRRSGSRYEQLAKLEVPSLVIHGQNDPFVPIAHSKKLASVLPNVMTKWYANMGHDIPPYLCDSLVVELSGNFKRNPN